MSTSAGRIDGVATEELLRLKIVRGAGTDDDLLRVVSSWWRRDEDTGEWDLLVAHDPVEDDRLRAEEERARRALEILERLTSVDDLESNLGQIVNDAIRLLHPDQEEGEGEAPEDDEFVGRVERGAMFEFKPPDDVVAADPTEARPEGWTPHTFTADAHLAFIRVENSRVGEIDLRAPHPGGALCDTCQRLVALTPLLMGTTDPIGYARTERGIRDTGWYTATPSDLADVGIWFGWVGTREPEVNRDQHVVQTIDAPASPSADRHVVELAFDEDGALTRLVLAEPHTAIPTSCDLCRRIVAVATRLVNSGDTATDLGMTYLEAMRSSGRYMARPIGADDVEFLGMDPLEAGGTEMLRMGPE